MSNTKHAKHAKPSLHSASTRATQRHPDPLTYQHPYDSMRRYAELLALRHDCARTRYSYYRAMRLLHEHHQTDPAKLGEEHLRDYILHVKTRKAWKPKTIRQTLACAKIFFVELLGHREWKVFSQVRTRDHDQLPAVLTRQQVIDLLASIRLRQYYSPLKLTTATQTPALLPLLWRPHAPHPAPAPGMDSNTRSAPFPGRMIPLSQKSIPSLSVGATCGFVALCRKTMTPPENFLLPPPATVTRSPTGRKKRPRATAGHTNPRLFPWPGTLPADRAET